MQPKNPILMMGSRSSPDFGHEVSGFSQAATVINDIASGGDDSLRRQQHARGSQGSSGNYSQDKFSFTGSDTIDIMGSCPFSENIECMLFFCFFSISCSELTHFILDAVRSAQKDIIMLKNMMVTRLDSIDIAMAQLAAIASEVNTACANLVHIFFTDLTLTCAATKRKKRHRWLVQQQT